MGKFQSRAIYSLKKVMVRSFNGQKYLTINKQTEVTDSDKTINREDEKSLDSHTNKVQCPVEGVESVQKFLSCSKCQASVPSTSEKRFVQCNTCNLAQLKTKCKTRTFVKVLFCGYYYYGYYFNHNGIKCISTGAPGVRIYYSFNFF